MRKTLLLLSLSACAAAAWANTHFQQAPKNTLADSHRIVTAIMHSPALLDAQDIIVTPPEGERSTYKMTADGFFLYLSDIMIEEGLVCPADVVWCENGDVYIENPCSQLAAGTWMKGTKTDDSTIEVQLPQAIYVDPNGVTYYVNRMELRGEGNDSWYYIVEEDNVVTYSIDEKGALTLDLPPNQEYILGLSVDNDPGSVDSWAKYGDFYQVLEPFTDEPASLPEGVEPQTWALLDAEQNGREVNVAFDGEDVYLGNIHDSFPNAYVKGTLNGNRISFPSGQYLGIDDQRDIFCYFMTGIRNELIFDPTIRINMNYDADAQRMTSPVGNAIFVNSGNERIYYIERYIEPEIYSMENIEFVGTPAMPIFNRFRAYNGRDAYIEWNIPPVDVGGSLLDTERMYYEIYVDNELFVFWPDEYRNIPYVMEEVPYLYCDYNWYDIFADGALHTIYFYFDGADSYGCRSIYRGEDGTDYYSEMATHFVNSVEDTFSSAEAVATEYYDIAGMRTSANARGLQIVTEIYADGTRRNVKRIVK